MWWRHTQEWADKLSNEEFIRFFDECKQRHDTYYTKECREIVCHKSKSPCGLDVKRYSVRFIYDIIYPPNFWNNESCAISRIIDDDIKFHYESGAQDYMMRAVRPSAMLSFKEKENQYKGLYEPEKLYIWRLYLHDDDWIKKTTKCSLVAFLFKHENIETHYMSFMLLEKWERELVNVWDIKSAIEIIADKYVVPEKPKTEVTTTVQSSTVISDSVLDQITKDVEKLRNTKNAFIVEEIERSVKYINTLKKLL